MVTLEDIIAHITTKSFASLKSILDALSTTFHQLGELNFNPVFFYESEPNNYLLLKSYDNSETLVSYEHLDDDLISKLSEFYYSMGILEHVLSNFSDVVKDKFGKISSRTQLYDLLDSKRRKFLIKEISAQEFYNFLDSLIRDLYYLRYLTIQYPNTPFNPNNPYDDRSKSFSENLYKLSFRSYILSNLIKTIYFAIENDDELYLTCQTRRQTQNLNLIRLFDPIKTKTSYLYRLNYFYKPICRFRLSKLKKHFRHSDYLLKILTSYYRIKLEWRDSFLNVYQALKSANLITDNNPFHKIFSDFSTYNSFYFEDFYDPFLELGLFFRVGGWSLMFYNYLVLSHVSHQEIDTFI